MRQWDELRQGLECGLLPDIDRAARAILPPLREQAARVGPLLPDPLVRLPLQPAIRDVRREHLLFTNDDVTGFIDFGAMRIDTPLADIARLLGSFVGDDAPARRVALDAYAALRPLSDADRRLIEVLDEAGLVMAGINWLTWLYTERRDMGEVPPIVRRLDEILQRLNARAALVV
jgi:Ser/Thr protein kinase RdoA (MazF antagonist)